MKGCQECLAQGLGGQHHSQRAPLRIALKAAFSKDHFQDPVIIAIIVIVVFERRAELEIPAILVSICNCNSCLPLPRVRGFHNMEVLDSAHMSQSLNGAI